MTPHTPQAARPRRGFTLVEVLCVVTILGIAAAVSIPYIAGRDDLKASAAARVVVAQVQWAQNRAITTQTPTFVGVTGQTLWVGSRSGGGVSTIDHPVTQEPFVTNFATNPSTAGVTLSGIVFGSASLIAFDELGSPYAASSDGVTLTPLSTSASLDIVAGVHRLTVRIEPFTGTISVN